MADGRRHSVDLPISKTLIALRRVRSLRDPSTNSMSKFSTLVDNMNWETNSSNGISLRFINGAEKLDFNEETENHENNLDSYQKPRKSCVETFFSNHIEDKQVEVSDYRGSYRISVHGHESFCERYRDGNRDLRLKCVTPSTNRLEDVDLNCERVIGLSSQNDNTGHGSNRPKNQIKIADEAGGILSHVGSPCLSIGDGPYEGSSCSASSFASDNFDGLDCDRDHDYHHRGGRGISCCFSNFPSDEEDDPLLLTEIKENYIFNDHKKISRNVKNEIVLYGENLRSLSQKFRPKSFNDLVGHNVVSRSLLSAISKGRITSFYIFHGPRGTGKTSAARIFAAALNCISHDEHYKPCVTCSECVQFFNGKSRDVKEIDSVRINRKNRFRSFARNASDPPISSRFKVFIIDECQLLGEETWATILNSFDNISQNIVFIMITADLDKLPRGAVSRSQKYHFPKIKEADITSRLEKIAIEEGLEFDRVALEFVAAKSNGSLRDAEMMLDQLSLLGKRITTSLAYELIGVVPDDELLQLLDLALSSDTSNTVKRAREMMKSRIDPMQLISQLANLIMDILAGKCRDDNSQVKLNFFSRHSSEADMLKLSHALKILSETEKQLRRSKNQMTWLTVALLQLSSSESTTFDPNDSRSLLRMPHQRDSDFCSTSSTVESLKFHMGMHGCDVKLEAIWNKTTELCQSHSLRNFLKNEGKLSSICVSRGLAVAELDFHHPSHVTRAEKSWKLIASSLQSILRCNVEIHINLVPHASTSNKLKVKKSYFNFFHCSRNTKNRPKSTSDTSEEYSDLTSDKATTNDNLNENCYSIRSNEGNSLSIGSRTMPCISTQENISERLEVGNDISNPEESKCGCERGILVKEADSPQKCLCGIVRLRGKSKSSISSQIIQKKAFGFCVCRKNGIFCCGANNSNRRFKDGDGQEESKVHCWKTPSFKKALQLRHQQQLPICMGCDLPCASTK